MGRFPRGKMGVVVFKCRGLHKKKCGNRKAQVSCRDLPGISCEVRKQQ